VANLESWNRAKPSGTQTAHFIRTWAKSWLPASTLPFNPSPTVQKPTNSTPKTQPYYHYLPRSPDDLTSLISQPSHNYISPTADLAITPPSYPVVTTFPRRGQHEWHDIHRSRGKSDTSIPATNNMGWREYKTSLDIYFIFRWSSTLYPRWPSMCVNVSVLLIPRSPASSSWAFT
jgi:hypothetical protein